MLEQVLAIAIVHGYLKLRNFKICSKGREGDGLGVAGQGALTNTNIFVGQNVQ